LKRKQWGSTLVQEKYQEDKACDKRHLYYNNNYACEEVLHGIKEERNIIYTIKKED